MPFGDYGGNSDSVVARLEFSMPTDAETKLADIGKAIESVRTSWEATNRFTKEFMDYMKELPDIEKKIRDLHATQTEGLKASTEALGEASEASDKLVSTPITASRVSGSGSGQPHIPSVDPAPVARAAHEDLTDEDRTKPEKHRATVQDSSAPPVATPHHATSEPAPAHRHEKIDSEQPAPVHHQALGSPEQPTPAYHEHPTSQKPAPHIAYQGTSTFPAPSRPSVPITLPAEQQPQNAPVVGHAPVVHVPTVPEANEHKKQFENYRSETEKTYSSSNPAPVARPPVPIPVADSPASTNQPLPSPQRPILPVETEFGTSVPPPPLASSHAAQVLGSRPPIDTIRSETRPEAQYPVIPPIEQTSATYDTPARSPSESPRDDREALLRSNTLPSSSLPSKTSLSHTQTNTPPPPPASPHPIWSARPPDVRSADGGSDRHSDDRGGILAGHDRIESSPPAPARPHTVSPAQPSTGPGIALPGARPPAHHETPFMGPPPPVPGHEQIQTHDQVTQPTPSPGGRPSRIEPSQGGPASRVEMPPAARPHTVSPETTTTGPGIASLGTRPRAHHETSAPSHEQIQTHGAAQSTQPVASPGGRPPRIEPSQGGPGSQAGQSAENIVIRAGSVKVETGAPTQVHSPESHVHTAQPPVVHSPSLTPATPRPPLVPLTATQAHEYRPPRDQAPPPPARPAHETDHPAETRLSDLRPPEHEQPHVDQRGVEGARVIGHIRPQTQQTQPTIASTTAPPKTPGQGQTTPPRPTGTAQPTSNADYRQKLGGQLKGNPAEIYDRLHQRGMTSETTGDNGEKQYQVHLGSRTVSSDEFMNDEAMQNEALDSLGQEAGPQSPENAGPLKRAMHAGGLLRNIGQTVKGGGNAEAGVGQLGDMVSSMGKAGGAMEGIGGAIGGAARFAGPVGLGVAAATGANALVQSGGQKVQDLYNEGTIRGGGTAQGAKMEAGVAAMALNPFITNEQSRQVIMGALNTGAQGPAYDSVTSFMKDNLTNLNISVADSAKMLNTNVKDGGQSIESLSLQLGNLKEQAKTGGQTFEQLKTSFTQRSGELVTQGAPGGAAGRQATEEALVFNQNLPSGAKNPLSGEFSQLSSQMQASDVVNAQQAAKYGPPGMDPMNAPSYMAEHNLGVEANADQIAQWVRSAKTGPEINWASNLVHIAKANKVTISLDKAKEYIKQFGDNPNAARDIAQGARDQANQGAGNTTEKKGIHGDVGDMFSAAGSQLAKMGDQLWGTDQDVERDNANIAAREGAYKNPALDKITSQYGLGNTVVYDPQGKPQKVDYGNKEQLEGLQSGEWKIAGASTPEAQEGLKNDWQKQAEEMKPGSQSLTDAVVSNTGDSGEGGGGGGGQFGLTPEAQQLLKLIPGGSNNNSPNTEDSNTGVGGATHNNPPPGNSGSPAAFPTG